MNVKKEVTRVRLVLVIYRLLKNQDQYLVPITFLVLPFFLKMYPKMYSRSTIFGGKKEYILAYKKMGVKTRSRWWWASLSVEHKHPPEYCNAQRYRETFIRFLFRYLLLLPKLMHYLFLYRFIIACIHTWIHTSTIVDLLLYTFNGRLPHRR